MLKLTTLKRMDDHRTLDEIVGIGTRSPVSGPWRLTVWDSGNSGKIFVFSEEHANKGSCPDQRHLSTMVSRILSETRGVHVLVENFIHANDISVPKSGAQTTKERACSAVNTGILNNLRNCLEVMKINHHLCPGGCAKRVHFIDPRVDMVSVLPDGKLFEAISHFTYMKASQGHFHDAVLTVFESIIHPLSSLLPDRRNLMGRLVGVFDVFRSKMNPAQRNTFDKIWSRDITGGITDLNARYVQLHKTYSCSAAKPPSSLSAFSRDVGGIMDTYKRYTNKFMDTWLLAHIFMIQNTPGVNGMVLYLGSLHGLETEKHLALHGLNKVHHSENTNLDSCLFV